MNVAESLNEIVEKEKYVAKELKSLVSNVTDEQESVIPDRFSKLREVNNLQKSIVRQNMHNAMSPISAISGYLELINLALSNEPDVKQIQHYRKQIEEGVQQVNVILEQLMELYNDQHSADVSEQEEGFVDVNLNWLVEEVTARIDSSIGSFTFRNINEPMYVRTDLFACKLIIFNLMNFAAKCAGKDKNIELTASENDGMAVLSIKFYASLRKKTDLINVMQADLKTQPCEVCSENSFNEGLLTSRKLTAQVNGNMFFEHLEDDQVKINLHIPLAG